MAKPTHTMRRGLFACVAIGGFFLSLTVSCADGICAKVRLAISQQAVVTRTAFRAVLELINDDATAGLSNIEASVSISDASGQWAIDRFGIESPRLTGLNSVDGRGVLFSGTRGTAEWTLIPSEAAASNSPTVYRIGGVLRYSQDGRNVVIPLEPVTVTVQPDAALDLKYFLQRDVFSDDPFTPEIEPALPFGLAVVVNNRGAGTARNLSLSSPTLKLVENEKGLLIGFNLLSAELNGQAIPAPLTVSFGDLGPGQRSTAIWALSATLQGLFIEYKAELEYVNGVGARSLSVFKSVEIHEMIHLVRDQRPGSDNQPDFLVNDVPDINDRPDTIHLSDGSIELVSVVEQGTPSGAPSAGNLEVQMVLGGASGGWTYVRLPEPANGQFRLAGVRRSDGTNLLADNFWTTDRTFIGLGRRPIRENILHLLDHDSTGSYTLIYDPAPTTITDTNAPISSVAALPAASRPYFQVSWSGQDEGPLGQAVAGVANYDVFVSENNGPFGPWLQQTHLVSATYVGAVGSHYAFYSVATDGNSNREAAPATPDAETTVSVTNHPPVISLPASVTINEGETLDVPITVSDPDQDQTLTLSLLGGVPPGVVLNSATRRLSWSTGEGNGPSTNVVYVLARDDGFPSLSSTGRMIFFVREVNSPPTLALLPNLTTNESQLIRFTVTASDTDLPRQALRFNLDGGAPAGATIDLVTGVFSWRPSETQGGTTNRIGIVVRDDGTPSLTATQAFTVVVRDTLPDFSIMLGTTNVLRGRSGSVPVQLRSGVDLTTVDFFLPLPSGGVGNLALQTVSPAVGGAVLQPVTTSNRVLVRITAAANNSLQGDTTLAQLTFTTATAGRSEIVRLDAESVSGALANGATVPNGLGLGGRIFVIGRQPILDAFVTINQSRGLTIYGNPGSNYVVESASNLLPREEWERFQQINLIGTFDTMLPISATASHAFYRAYEVQPPAVGPNLSVGTIGNQTIIEWPAANSNCNLMVASSLVPPINWTPATLPIEMVGGMQRIIVTATNSSRFFKLVCPQ